MTAAQSPTMNTIGGYKLVRRLGQGTRAQVFLGSSIGETDGTPRTAAVKVFRAEVGRESIQSELEALSLAQLPHCSSLLDVASVDTGVPVAILRRVSRGSVGQLLRERSSLEPGEAVTLLAPIALLANALHQAGVAHTAIGAGKVHLTEAGEPVLLGFGGARLLVPGAAPAALDDDAAVLADRQSLARLALVVLEQLRTGGGSAQRDELCKWIRGVQHHDFSFAPELAERLFSLAPAMPIEFPRSAAGIHDALPARFGIAAALPQETGSQELATAPRRHAWLAALHLPEWTDGLLADHPFEGVRARLGVLAGSVRRPVWIAGGAVTLALLAALLMTGSPRAADGMAGDGVAAPASGVPAPAEEVPAASHLPEDPVRALPELLAARERCIRDLSVLCLEGVHQVGSAAMTDDAALIRRILSGQELSPQLAGEVVSAELVERLGDSALVSVGSLTNSDDAESDPASVLMIRTEAGWRIRAFLASASAEP